jgi:hypothetical protein
MLLLTSTSDKLQIISIITSQAASIDVHASWVDNASNNITPGRTNSVITTAATTNVIAAPAAGGSAQLQSFIGSQQARDPSL